MIALCSVFLFGIGVSLFLRFLGVTGARRRERRGTASYARGTRKLWHFVVPMAWQPSFWRRSTRLGPGVFRIYLILLLIPTLGPLGAWF
ncbi:MAG: hypothetical protein U0835_13445 [Isosphaeraceae bacterium]